jgi:ankyrin repeat protein
MLVHFVVLGKVACLKMLCELQNDLNIQDDYGATALHYAAQKDHCSCILLLIRHGADVNARDANGKTPLNWAAAEGKHQSISVLLEEHADINAQCSVKSTGKSFNTHIRSAS